MASRRLRSTAALFLATLGCQSGPATNRPAGDTVAERPAALAPKTPGPAALTPGPSSPAPAVPSPLPSVANAPPLVPADESRQSAPSGTIQLVQAQAPLPAETSAGPERLPTTYSDPARATPAVLTPTIATQATPARSVQGQPVASVFSQPAATMAPGAAIATPRPAPQPGLLGLGDALATSLAMNPDLLTLRGAVDVSAAVVRVAGVYPWNPFVQAQFFPNGTPFTPSSNPGGAAGNSNYYVWLMQRFELGHQRSHRQESAQAAFGQVRWNVRQAELMNVAQTERLYFTALYQRQLLDLAVDTQALAERLQNVLDRRFKSGIANAVEVSNARVAARQARRQRQLADATYNTALLALVQQMGLPPGTPVRLAGSLTDYHWTSVAAAYCSLNPATPIDATAFAAELAEARPDVQAARSGSAVAQANLSLARSARIQDVQAGPIYETADDGTRYLGFRLQRDFGVFNNGAALVGQREAELRQQVVGYQQLRRRAANEAAAAIDRYERARAYAAEGAAEADATRSAELNQIVAQFEAGRADVLNVLAIQGNLLLDVRAALDLSNELAQAATMVTQTTGLPAERLLAAPGPTSLPPAPVEELPPAKRG